MQPIHASRWTTSHVSLGGASYERIVVRTRWLTPDDDLPDVLRASTAGLTLPGDTIVVSEKVAVLLTGRSLPISSIRPGPLARLLASGVRPQVGALDVPEKMQYVLERTGRTRLLIAAAASAITRPLGVHGVFYRLVGPLARDIDGACPPFERVLFPPFDPGAATELCTWLESVLDLGVAIIDINDFGGTIRAMSGRSIRADVLCGVLSDNPLGQDIQRTPIGIVRAVHAPAATMPVL